MDTYTTSALNLTNSFHNWVKDNYPDFFERITGEKNPQEIKFSNILNIFNALEHAHKEHYKQDVQKNTSYSTCDSLHDLRIAIDHIESQATAILLKSFKNRNSTLTPTEQIANNVNSMRELSVPTNPSNIKLH